MKKYLLLAVLLLCSLFAYPTYAQEYEHISEFNSSITINQDATIDIVEEIHYHFDTLSHGIYWEYPIEYSVSGFKRATSFDLNEMYYYPEDNPDLKKSVYEKTVSSGWVELKIGEADTTIKGDYIYVVDYTLKDAGVSYFKDHDEVYLNVIGPGWQVPILQATATINTFTDSTDKVCYTGEDSLASQNCEFTQMEDGYILEATSTLYAYEGLTMALKFPKGSIENRTTWIWIGIVISNLGILLPIPVILFFISLLKKKWSNKEITVIPHYKAPEDMDPLIAGYIYQSKQDFKHISAAIIWMAVKGYVSIEKDGNKTFINKKVDSIESVSSHIESLFNSLFGQKDKVNIGNIPTSFTTKIQSIFSSTRSNSSQYINKKRLNTKGILMVLGTLTAFFGFFFLSPILSAYAAVGTSIGIGLSGIAMAIIAFKIDIRSDEGNKMRYELEGLKMYIDTAEKHRIEFHNDPDKFRGVFETLLPFAIIFGLEKKWAKEFEDLYKDTQPDWYRGDISAFDVYMINRSLNTLNRSIKTSTARAYGSSSGFRSGGWSSGGSGFGGGGHSGGGAGGSGGGSW